MLFGYRWFRKKYKQISQILSISQVYSQDPKYRFFTSQFKSRVSLLMRKEFIENSASLQENEIRNESCMSPLVFWGFATCLSLICACMGIDLSQKRSHQLWQRASELLIYDTPMQPLTELHMTLLVDPAHIQPCNDLGSYKKLPIIQHLVVHEKICCGQEKLVQSSKHRHTHRGKPGDTSLLKSLLSKGNYVLFFLHGCNIIPYIFFFSFSSDIAVGVFQCWK